MLCFDTVLSALESRTHSPYRVTTNLENLEYSGISTNVESSGNSVQPQGKFLSNKIVSFQSNISITQQGLWLQMNTVSWISKMVTVRWWPVILLELMWNDPWHMKVIITFTFCCNNLWKNIAYGSVKAWKTPGIFFYYFVVTLPKPRTWPLRSMTICKVKAKDMALTSRRRPGTSSLCTNVRPVWNSVSRQGILNLFSYRLEDLALQQILSSVDLPFLLDWFHGLSNHLTILLCSTAGFVCMVC